jgi:plastocyanin
MHFGTPLVRSPDLALLVRRAGIIGLLAVSAIAMAAPSVRRANAAQRPATGRIEGQVEISPSLTARRPQFRIYADPGSGALPPAAPRDPIAAELRNVVLYLEGDSARLASSPSPEPRVRATMAQRDERFVPHVRAVMQGATVDFPNEDDLFHNVFSLSAAARFDLGRYPKGSSRSVTFTKPGLVQVFCHIHADMSAYVWVLSNPYFASPGEDHRFVIDDVPEGDYTIVGWHERIKPITKRVHVTAGQTTTIDFNIPLLQGGGSGR